MKKTSLANQFLIALPSLKDPNFEKSVILICEHDTHGSVGIIINRPMQYPLQIVFDQLKIVSEGDIIAKRPLLYGGPVQPERGFVIHRPEGVWKSSLVLTEEATVTTSNDIIRALATNTGPVDSLVALGYVGWDEDQLDQELKNNTWLVCPFKAELLYEVPYGQRWGYAGMLMGVRMHDIISNAGHA